MIQILLNVGRRFDSYPAQSMLVAQMVEQQTKLNRLFYLIKLGVDNKFENR